MIEQAAHDARPSIGIASVSYTHLDVYKRQLLTCNHVVNQYLFIDDSAEILRKFEQTARNMHSLSRYSRSNQILSLIHI